METFEFNITSENKLIKKGTFFGVCDGHGDYHCALVTARDFPKFVINKIKKQDLKSLDDIGEIIKKSFSEFDTGLKNVKGGCCIVVCMIIEKHVWLLHAGDSKGIIFNSLDSGDR
eukprot:UN32834